jgi:hypothetical protein
MLTAQQAFKFGFLARCAADGLTPAQTVKAAQAAREVLEKRAFLGSLVDKGLDLAKGVGGGAVSYGVPLALAAPPVLGGLAGYGLARATDIDDTEIADIKDRELIDEYTRQADRLRQQASRRARQQPSRPAGRPLM